MAYMSDGLIAALEDARTAPPPSLPPPRSLHAGHPQGLVVMPEATWRWALARLPAAERARFTAWRAY
jgi:hypothetical protein